MNISQLAATAGLDAIKALLNGGTLTMYSGTEPVSPETALSGDTVLATWTFSATAFSSDTTSGGYTTATASFVSATVTPSANGTASFARLTESNGTTVCEDLTVGTSSADIIIGSTTLNTGVQVTLSLSFKVADV
jgi:hypothetical protein